LKCDNCETDNKANASFVKNAVKNYQLKNFFFKVDKYDGK
jgi:hypothetical protein